jgi:hypothetical protein
MGSIGNNKRENTIKVQVEDSYSKDCGTVGLVIHVLTTVVGVAH